MKASASDSSRWSPVGFEEEGWRVGHHVVCQKQAPNSTHELMSRRAPSMTPRRFPSGGGSMMS